MSFAGPDTPTHQMRGRDRHGRFARPPQSRDLVPDWDPVDIPAPDLRPHGGARLELPLPTRFPGATEVTVSQRPVLAALDAASLRAFFALENEYKRSLEARGVELPPLRTRIGRHLLDADFFLEYS